MTPDELRAIMDFLRQRVVLGDRGADGEVAIGFDVPSADEIARAGLDPEGCRQILNAPWWDEMAADVVETPEMCDPEDPPEQVLEYARDVVSEYLRKRAKL
ncbi:MAG: hypothetical protein ABIP48_04110 [Planctomycetota bacterium]